MLLKGARWAMALTLYMKALLNAKPISVNIVPCATNAGMLVAALLFLGNVGALTTLSMGTVVLVSVSGVMRAFALLQGTIARTHIYFGHQPERKPACGTTAFG